VYICRFLGGYFKPYPEFFIPAINNGKRLIWCKYSFSTYILRTRTLCGVFTLSFYAKFIYPRCPINNNNTYHSQGCLFSIWRYWPRKIVWGYQMQRAASFKTTNSRHKMRRSINRLIVQWVSANAQASQKHHNKSMHKFIKTYQSKFHHSKSLYKLYSTILINPG
jgi:hypothetical protein